MTTKTDDIKLPPLPEHMQDVAAWLEAHNDAEIARDILNYARAAVEADRRAPVAQGTPQVADAEIEKIVIALGARWNGSVWAVEDADLHPLVRSLLSRHTSAPVAAQAQPTGYEEAGSFIWDGDEWRMAAAKYGEDPDVVTLYKRVNAQDEPQPSGNSGELPTAQDREDATYQRDVAIGMLAHWVVAIEKNGTGWDDWDEHFKNARFRDTPIRKLLDEAIDAARAAKWVDHG
ncbi:hypothetical protein [Castellaniella denitrificans]|uniref:Uncharacterized protein n=1 Tax=Castellaniella denitrificans TaxID=56119 RepID=A0ABT4M6U8_9BURK|nr:hypothetical protein [Castellaniella denitrificans]MCZ4331047.1 hypothetical protein [Castellaniella denitrificans]